jgi:hypothetical protein
MQIRDIIADLAHKPELLLLLDPVQDRPQSIPGRRLRFTSGPLELLSTCATMLGSAIVNGKPVPKSEQAASSLRAIS